MHNFFILILNQSVLINLGQTLKIFNFHQIPLLPILYLIFFQHQTLLFDYFNLSSKMIYLLLNLLGGGNQHRMNIRKHFFMVWMIHQTSASFMLQFCLNVLHSLNNSGKKRICKINHKEFLPKNIRNTFSSNGSFCNCNLLHYATYSNHQLH